MQQANRGVVINRKATQHHGKNVVVSFALKEIIVSSADKQR